MPYSITLETFTPTYAELEPLYREHYAEMQARLAGEGVQIGPYNPRLDEYRKAGDGGWLLTFVVRDEGKAIGYANIYLTQDMHNSQPISSEDTIFVTKAHRNGIGRRLTKFIIEELRGRGVLRAWATTATDPRVALMLERMGWRRAATVMVYNFEDPKNAPKKDASSDAGPA